MRFAAPAPAALIRRVSNLSKPLLALSVVWRDRAPGLRGWFTWRIEVMTKLAGCVAAIAIGAAVAATTPAVALHAGGMRMGRQVAGCAPLAHRRCVGGLRDPACFGHRRHFRIAFVGGPNFYSYGTYGNYCWQQVWTPSGWQWADACAAGYFAFSH
jgi:hypothetical protein